MAQSPYLAKAGTPPTACSPSRMLEVDSTHTGEDDEWADDFSSITSSILDYEFENGRRYHAYKAGYYPLPNDETELDRLDLQHHVYTLLLNGELHLAPLEHPKRVLDIGTGTGIWAIEMADKFPQATIIGTDLSPTQPTWVPDNVQFEIDDIESEWLYKENHFDYIHSRLMLGSISDWQGMIANAYKHCKPGGHFEIQELDPRLASDDGSVAKSKWHKLFTDLGCEASLKYGKPVPIHTDFRRWIQEAGFVDIKETFFKVPVNTWPKNKQLKEVGKYQLINYSEGYEGIGIGLFTRALKWTPSEFQVLLAKIRVELKDRNIHTYQPFAVIHGRKPFPDEMAQDVPRATFAAPEHPISAHQQTSPLTSNGIRSATMPSSHTTSSQPTFSSQPGPYASNTGGPLSNSPKSSTTGVDMHGSSIQAQYSNMQQSEASHNYAQPQQSGYIHESTHRRSGQPLNPSTPSEQLPRASVNQSLASILN